ncbi:MAG TPA: hypothetical protein PKW75_00070 [candidate division Zixibacteria bacterium]|nr:hypothetical protein [candidate division Zixibacteria bacterium]MDD4918246.1 hypothetical protein [candidate division Zixibacteria bacterium]MDM7973987.1 hypothetical protein [candidate division Zixibacteria bacterium]HOD66522.1 hypothetical protein [candidate division Zixibacteria bacterium]HOZ06657.1 hypothetical protein [candidate division Zixibacteria bacterium]
MAQTREHTSGARGTSLLEVLIALVVMGVITTALFGLYITQHRTYISQDDVTLVQQNARASIDELARHIRMTGHGLPLEMMPLSAFNTDPDTIVIRYRTDNCETYLAEAMATPSSDLTCATDVGCFQPGEWVYILEPDSGGGEWLALSEVQTGARVLRHGTMVLSKAYAKDALVLTARQVTFYVDTTTDPQHPALTVKVPGQTPQVFAENVEDLQLQYRMKNGLVVDVPVVVSDVREVLISITARSNRPDHEMAEVTGHSDAYRRRTFTTSVFLRNVGI